MGFIKAIKRFDLQYDVKLSTYAVPYILGEIKKFIRDDGIIKVSRSIKELNMKISRLEEEHLRKTGENISLQELQNLILFAKEINASIKFTELFPNNLEDCVDIETLRKQGYTEDDILLALIEARCNPNPNSGKNVSKQKEKTKKYVYKSDIFNKK